MRKSFVNVIGHTMKQMRMSCKENSKMGKCKEEDRKWERRWKHMEFFFSHLTLILENAEGEHTVEEERKRSKPQRQPKKKKKKKGGGRVEMNKKTSNKNVSTITPQKHHHHTIKKIVSTQN